LVGNVRVNTVCATLVMALSLCFVLGLDSSKAIAGSTSSDVTVDAQVVASEPAGTSSLKATVAAGQQVVAATATVKLTGLEPYSFVEVFVESTPVLIASGFADAYGVFSVIANLPPYLEEGQHKITATLQLLGQTVARYELRSFSVSATGRTGKPTSNNGGGSGQPTPSPKPTQSGQVAATGMLLSGGLQSQVKSHGTLASPDLILAAVVSNKSRKSFNVLAEFSLQGPFGLYLRRPLTVNIEKLKPNETRTVRVKFRNIGEWGIYTAGVVMTPPTKLKSANIHARTLQTSVFVWPNWLLVIYILAVLYFMFDFFTSRSEWLRKIVREQQRFLNDIAKRIRR